MRGHSRRRVLQAGLGAVAGSVVLGETATADAAALDTARLPWVADLGMAAIATRCSTPTGRIRTPSGWASTST
ncbi:hypothetical protein SAMN05661093_11150 [Kibdelosporangium aridum]|uniref:Uncharacterized protein n=1 Tax=Kibdelosporangium aridum TaxID=2030 RepID=A0A1W2G0M9_KIBAR|nr:hypothetical protein SAMN05661093_11150 [Kibdelosporangium aridum]